MPTFAVPLTVRTKALVNADSAEMAEDIVRTNAKSLFPSEDTEIDTDMPACKSAYEVSVMFYLNAFTSDEAEDTVCDLVRNGIRGVRDILYDVEKIVQNGPCRG